MPPTRRFTLVCLFIGSTFPYPSQSFTPQGQWALPSVLVNDTVYLYGGSRNSTIGTNTFISLDLSRSWTTDSPPYTDRTAQASAQPNMPNTAYGVMFPSADNTSLWIYGGGSSKLAPLTHQFAEYSVKNQSWNVQPSYQGTLPPQRREAAVAWTQTGMVYIWGGVADNYTGIGANNVNFFSDMLIFDTRKSFWKSLNPSAINQSVLPMVEHTATLLSSGQIVYVGGQQLQINIANPVTDYTPMTEILIFDTNSNMWSHRTAIGSNGAIPPPRGGHIAGLGPDGKSVVIFGGSYVSNASTGESYHIYNDLWVLDTSMFQWTPITGEGVSPSPRTAASGWNQGIGYSDTTILNLTTNPWSWTSIFNPPIYTSNTTTSNSTSTPISDFTVNPLQAIGGSLGLVAIVTVGVIILVATVFLAVFKPWRRPEIPYEPWQRPEIPYESSHYNDNESAHNIDSETRRLYVDNSGNPTAEFGWPSHNPSAPREVPTYLLEECTNNKTITPCGLHSTATATKRSWCNMSSFLSFASTMHAKKSVGLMALALASTVSAFIPPTRWASECTLIKQTVYCYGGESIGPTDNNNLYALDVSQTFNVSSNPPWIDRTSDAGSLVTSSVAYFALAPLPDGRSFIINGGSSNALDKSIPNDTLKYNGVSHNWTIPITSGAAMVQRREHSAAYDDQGKVYFWGGLRLFNAH
ncbi:hypothetical protein BC937DRAFT_87455 [Endogone sp. FLAS-F59071]|nr:hypothetical protein BC937DRAFT_87455 [Endogone sp. FLAS-F59071]|eukprot:RUS19448.1 hypothetical protein BC937DRAFT_87455 [Endogone sp. FLAS-F59071]